MRLVAAAGLLCAGAALAQAPVPAAITAGRATSSAEARAEIQDSLPQGRLIGQGRLSVWGFQVYDARLWAGADFGAAAYASQPLTLELAYLRDFEAIDIAERSIKEMRRSATITDAQARQWRLDMQRVFPDVKAGDRIMGVHRPGNGASFWVNGQASGEILDTEFSEMFFGIWLSPKTSEQAMRTALLKGAAP